MSGRSVENDGSSTSGTQLLDGLFCPQCDYSLTGLQEHRCPECGEEFDPGEVRAQKSTEPLEVPSWKKGKARFGRTGGYLYASWAFLRSPTRFARSLPYRSHPLCPLYIGLGTRLVSLILFILLAPKDILTYVGCSLLFDLLLSLICWKTCRTRNAYPFSGWREWFFLIQYTYIYLPLFLALLLMLEIVLNYIQRWTYMNDVWLSGDTQRLMKQIALFLVFLLFMAYWFSFSRLISGRCRGLSVRIMQYVVLPVFLLAIPPIFMFLENCFSWFGIL